MSAAATRRNAATGLVLAAVAAGMVGLAFAAVPLYRLFCQVTGFGGTTQISSSAPATIGERIVTVRLDSVVNSRLPWRFEPVERAVTLRVGEERLVHYRATNLSDQAVTGAATFNVTPLKAGVYFNKIACFCFEQQRLEAGESADMPVSFFVDPAISEDPNLDDVKTITLTYTFFRATGTAGYRATGTAGYRATGTAGFRAAGAAGFRATGTAGRDVVRETARAAGDVRPTRGIIRDGTGDREDRQR